MRLLFLAEAVEEEREEEQHQGADLGPGVTLVEEEILEEGGQREHEGEMLQGGEEGVRDLLAADKEHHSLGDEVELRVEQELEEEVVRVLKQEHGKN